MALPDDDYGVESFVASFSATYEIPPGPYTANVSFLFEGECSWDDDYKIEVLEAGLEAMKNKIDTDKNLLSYGYTVTLKGAKEIVTEP